MHHPDYLHDRNRKVLILTTFAVGLLLGAWLIHSMTHHPAPRVPRAPSLSPSPIL